MPVASISSTCKKDEDMTPTKRSSASAEQEKGKVKMVVRRTTRRSMVQVSVVGYEDDEPQKRIEELDKQTREEELVVDPGCDPGQLIKSIPVQDVPGQAQQQQPACKETEEGLNKDEKIPTPPREKEGPGPGPIPKKSLRRGRAKRREVGGGGGGYCRYVHRVLEQVHPGMGVSAKAMAVMDNYMKDMFERLAEEAARLVDYSRRRTLTSREIQGAVKLVLPGELGKNAIAQGTKAVINFMSHA
ncbi:hypothetical protein Dimus_009464 [Dionaea muscipula]